MRMLLDSPVTPGLPISISLLAVVTLTGSNSQRDIDAAGGIVRERIVPDGGVVAAAVLLKSA